MGRKSINRQRKQNNNKTQEWSLILFPYLQVHGLKGITMDSVAKELQISKATLYDYFQTKEELIALTLQCKLEKIRGFEYILNNEQLNFPDRCYKMLKYLADHISGISNLFLADLKAYYPNLWKEVDLFLEGIAVMMQEFYKKGIEQKAFNEINPRVLAVTDQVFFRALSDPTFLSQQNLTIQEAFEQYAQLKFFGLVRS